MCRRAHSSPRLTRCVGLNEREAKAAGLDYVVKRLPVAAVPKAQVMRRPDGLMKAIVERNTGRILGAMLLSVESHEVSISSSWRWILNAPASNVARYGVHASDDCRGTERLVRVVCSHSTPAQQTRVAQPATDSPNAREGPHRRKPMRTLGAVVHDPYVTAITSEPAVTSSRAYGPECRRHPILSGRQDEPAKTERQAGSQGQCRLDRVPRFWSCLLISMVPLGCGRGGRTIAVRLWFEDFDVAVTGFVQSLILIPDTGCAIVAGLTRREKCLVFLVSAHLFTRDGMFFKQSQ